ncbi:hypothetical protein GCM10009627_23870 [Curtobacterium herbarum]|uniref:Uncharacterized protein n=1 Tax=Curtobacterium herbarum TaxID=150122 RepID=A0ABN1ZED7_9MICO
MCGAWISFDQAVRRARVFRRVTEVSAHLQETLSGVDTGRKGWCARRRGTNVSAHGAPKPRDRDVVPPRMTVPFRPVPME